MILNKDDVARLSLEELTILLKCGTIDSDGVALIKEEMGNREAEKVRQIVTPYLRSSDSKIVYWCESKKCYKARIPNALRAEGSNPPQYAKTEGELWDKLYEYLLGVNKTSLRALWDKYTEERKADPTISSQTVARDGQIWRKYIYNHQISKTPIAEITGRQLLDYYKSISVLDPNRTLNTNEKNRTRITRKNLINVKSVINGMFDMAVYDGLIPLNIARNVSTKKIRCADVNNDQKVYTDDQRETLLTYLENIPATAYSLAISLMFCLDIRIGELAALRWEDYDPVSKTIFIGREVVRRKDKDGKNIRVELDGTKGGEGGSRILPISDRASKILARAKDLNPDTEHIFVTQAGTLINAAKFNEALERYDEACGIPYLSSHKIRFWAVTAQAKENADLSTIMYNSGHKNKETTLHYIRRAKTEQQNKELWNHIFN